MTVPFDPLTEHLQGRRKLRISACMIAKDAERTIADALLSLRFCDQIIVIVDAATTDKTEAIARELAHHVERRTWEGFSSAWKYALSKGEGDWLFMIAADEVVTPVLAQSILEAITHDHSQAVLPKAPEPSLRGGRSLPDEAIFVGAKHYDGFLMRRRTRFLGRFLKHGDWGRDFVLRIVRRTKFGFNDSLIHESLKHPGRTRILDGFLLHEGERSLEEYRRRQEHYTNLSAEQMFRRGRRVTIFGLLLKPPFRFIRSYILRLGFLDGRQGFSQAWHSAVYVYTRYSKLRKLYQKASAS